jgi:hypothetical protein
MCVTPDVEDGKWEFGAVRSPAVAYLKAFYWREISASSRYIRLGEVERVGVSSSDSISM